MATIHTWPATDVVGATSDLENWQYNDHPLNDPEYVSSKHKYV